MTGLVTFSVNGDEVNEIVGRRELGGISDILHTLMTALRHGFKITFRGTGTIVLENGPCTIELVE